jgi:ABC-type nitrate/sulfonate/bicarbonate transport system substrate-binding protein
MTTRHSWASYCVALLMGLLLAPVGFAQDKISMGLSSVSGLHTATWVAQERGLFRKHNIDAEVIVTGQGGTVGIAALLSNDVQMISSAGDLLAAAALRGGEAVMLAGVVNKGLQRILTVPEIKTPADLKGKRVGVTRIGAVSHVVLQMMMQRWKMNPADVQVMQVGSSPDMLISLDKKGIDAAVLTIPSMFVAEDRGYRVLIDMADTDIYYLHTMIGSTRGYVKNNRDKVSRFLKGYLEGIAFVKQNRKESIDIVKKKLRIGPAQERNLQRAVDLVADKYYEQVPYTSQRGVETVLGFIEKDNPKAKTVDPKSLYDDSLLREIEQSGFVTTLYAK